MPTSTTRNYLVIRFQWYRCYGADLVDETSAEHCARLAAEALVVRDQTLARGIGTEVRHDPGAEDNPIRRI